MRGMGRKRKRVAAALSAAMMEGDVEAVVAALTLLGVRMVLHDIPYGWTAGSVRLIDPRVSPRLGLVDRMTSLRKNTRYACFKRPPSLSRVPALRKR